jgi:hypothetical protein
MSDQWVRKLGLILYSGDKGLDLSDLHIKFSVRAAQIESPNTASIRVYNLAKETVNQIQVRGEFSDVTLNAGYVNGNYGVIFQGTIKQFHIGRESATDTYLDILAADGDLGYNEALINTSIAAGHSQEEIIKALGAAMPQTTYDDKTLGESGIKTSLTNFPNIRGVVLWGLPKIYLRNYASTFDAAWSIQNGKLVFQSNRAYLPGEIVKLNAETGLIGFPEQTDGGINITCLINSRMRIGGRVQIDNNVINQLVNQKNNLIAVAYNAPYAIQHNAPLAGDGVYMIFAIDYDGDTRGHPWYCHLTCLAMDTTAPKDKAVPAESG